MAGKEFDTTAAAMALRTGENNALAKTIADKPWVRIPRWCGAFASSMKHTANGVGCVVV